MNQFEPCDFSAGKMLQYCVEGGNKVAYIFNDYRLIGIMYLTAFLTKAEAEKELIEEVNSFSVKNGISPTKSNGMALFYLPNNPLTISFGIRENIGTVYLMYYTFIAQ